MPDGGYLAVAAVAAVVTFLGTFGVRALAPRLGLVDRPGGRRVHLRPTPLGGGAAMLLGVVVAMAVAGLLPGLGRVTAGSSEPLGVCLGAAVMFGVGLIDDFREMSAPAKVAGEVLAASVLVVTGVTLFQLKVPFAGFVVLSPQMIPLLTALWVIVITNAVNLIDGLDGLAAGVVGIAAAALCVYGLRLIHDGSLPADNLGPLLAAVTVGACVGFLPHNVHPAKVFMGDSGALLLGLLMAAATMVVGGRTSEVVSGQTYFFFAPLFIPLFILGVPIADMVFAIVRRTARRQGFHTPDKDHVHHRLLRLGHGHRRTVVILWAWTAVLSGFVLTPLFVPAGNAVIPFGAAVLGLLLYTFFHPGLHRGGDPAEMGAVAEVDQRDPGAEPSSVVAPVAEEPTAVLETVPPGPRGSRSGDGRGAPQGPWP